MQSAGRGTRRRRAADARRRRPRPAGTAAGCRRAGASGVPAAGPSPSDAGRKSRTNESAPRPTEAPPKCLPHPPHLVRRAVGDRDVLGAGEQRLHQPRADRRVRAHAGARRGGRCRPCAADEPSNTTRRTFEPIIPTTVVAVDREERGQLRVGPRMVEERAREEPLELGVRRVLASRATRARRAARPRECRRARAGGCPSCRAGRGLRDPLRDELGEAGQRADPVEVELVERDLDPRTRPRPRQGARRAPASRGRRRRSGPRRAPAAST